MASTGLLIALSSRQLISGTRLQRPNDFVLTASENVMQQERNALLHFGAANVTVLITQASTSRHCSIIGATILSWSLPTSVALTTTKAKKHEPFVFLETAVATANLNFSNAPLIF
jgi:hypothetical protein